jgi:hypothetical protein
MTRTLTIAGFLLVLLGQAQAQTARPPAARTGPTAPAKAAALTNEDLITLAKAGFGDELLLARIKQAPERSFDLSTKGLLQLKEARISERVMTVMLGGPDKEPTSTPAPGSSGTTTPAATPAWRAPAPAHATGPEVRDAGIYWKAADGVVALEPTVFSGGKTGGVLTSGLTMGIKKAKWKAVVRSPRAVTRLTATTPEFYFYFETRGSGLSHTGGVMGSLMGASSPNEFVLARMTAKDTERELIVGQFGAFGASSGTRSEDTIELAIEKLAAGVYRVAPRGPLPAGEYCFFHAAGASMVAAAGTGKLFDFGVDDGATAR